MTQSSSYAQRSCIRDVNRTICMQVSARALPHPVHLRLKGSNHRPAQRRGRVHGSAQACNGGHRPAAAATAIPAQRVSPPAATGASCAAAPAVAASINLLLRLLL